MIVWPYPYPLSSSSSIIITSIINNEHAHLHSRHHHKKQLDVWYDPIHPAHSIHMLALLLSEHTGCFFYWSALKKDQVSEFRLWHIYMKNICTKRNIWTVVIIHNMEPAVSNLWQYYIIVITNTVVSSVASLSLYVSIAMNSKSCFLDDVEKYNFEELNNSVIWKYLWLGQMNPIVLRRFGSLSCD